MKIKVPNVELKVIELEKRVLAQAILAESQEIRIEVLLRTQTKLMKDLSRALTLLDERVSQIENDVYD